MRILLFLLTCLAVLGASAQTNVAGGALSTPTNATPSLATNSAAGLAGPSGYVPDDKYKLRPGDKVSLQIIEDREPPKSLTVADSGELDIPYVGRLTATDKTCKQLVEEATKLLEKDYYHRATVVIALDQAFKVLGRVYVVGHVRNQGAIEMQVNENLTAAKAILRAGGLSDFAKEKEVKIVRTVRTPASTNVVTFVVDMGEVLKRGKIEKDILLEPDDFVIVPPRLISF